MLEDRIRLLQKSVGELRAENTLLAQRNRELEGENALLKDENVRIKAEFRGTAKVMLDGLLSR